MTFSGTIAGIESTVRALTGYENKVMDATYIGVQRGVLGSQSIVRGHARGRPGPRAPTGDFNRTIVGQAERAGSKIFGQVGTNAAQALRLEYGFIGRDRLDREYDQSPYPYLQPSVPEVRALLGREVTAAITKALN